MGHDEQISQYFERSFKTGFFECGKITTSELKIK